MTEEVKSYVIHYGFHRGVHAKKKKKKKRECKYFRKAGFGVRPWGVVWGAVWGAQMCLKFWGVPQSCYWYRSWNQVLYFRNKFHFYHIFLQWWDNLVLLNCRCCRHADDVSFHMIERGHFKNETCSGKRWSICFHCFNRKLERQQTKVQRWSITCGRTPSWSTCHQNQIWKFQIILRISSVFKLGPKFYFFLSVFYAFERCR